MGEQDLSTAALMFNWVEYSVFCSMLLFSLLIGVYYGWFKKQDTVAEYMLGGKKMGVFPITMSMITSYVSGLTLLGVPGEIYTHGTQFTAFVFCIIALYFITNCLYLPVFYPLQLNSLYEYLEMRFSQGTRTIASLVFAVSLLIYLPLVIYVPALAFNQVTGLSVPWISLIITLICIFYTLFGGLKAVVWTDTLQGVFTLCSTLFIVFLGFWKIGSVSEVVRLSNEGGRLELFNFDPNPFARMSFWTYSIGSLFPLLAGVAVHPGAVRRFTAVSSFGKAKRVTFWTCIGYLFINLLVVVVGLLEYAYYYNCDPVATKRVHKAGQILPLFVMEIAKSFPGLTGMFLTGAVSAALSALSAGLNTVAGTLYEDFVMYVLKNKKLPDTQQNCIVKIIVMVLGLLCTSLVLIVEKLGAIYQVGMALQGVTNGALCGIFTLGVFFPRANAKGAIAGSLSSLVIMGVIVLGAQYYSFQGLLKFPGKMTSVEGCPTNFTSSLGFNASEAVQMWTGIGSPVVADDSVGKIFQISFLYYSLAGVVIVLIVGLLVSYLTEPVDSKYLDPKLFSPCVRRFLPQKGYSLPPPPEEYKLVTTNESPEEPSIESVVS